MLACIVSFSSLFSCLAILCSLSTHLHELLWHIYDLLSINVDHVGGKKLKKNKKQNALSCHADILSLLHCFYMAVISKKLLCTPKKTSLNALKQLLYDLIWTPVINLMMSLVSSNHRWTGVQTQPGLSCVWRGFWTSPRTIYPNVNKPVWPRSPRPPDHHPTSGPVAPPPSLNWASSPPELDRISCSNAARGRRRTGRSMHTQSSSTPAR